MLKGKIRENIGGEYPLNLLEVEMKKIYSASALLLAIIGVFVFAGCSSQAKDVDLKNVMQTINSEYKIDSTTEIADKSRLKTLYQIDEADVESFAAEIDEQGMNEIILVKAVDADAAKRVSDKLQIRLNSKRSLAASYDAETLDLIKKCEVATNDNVYVRLIVTEDVESVVETYNGFFK